MVELVITLAELVEAEGRALRRAAERLSWAVALIAAAALLTVGGAGFCLWGLYQGIEPIVGAGWAGVITGAATLLFAASLAWIAHRMSR